MAEFRDVNLGRIRGITLGILGLIYVLMVVMVCRKTSKYDWEETMMVLIPVFGVMWIAQWLVLAGRALPTERSNGGVLIGLGFIFGVVNAVYGGMMGTVTVYPFSFWVTADLGFWVIMLIILGFGMGFCYVLFTGLHQKRYAFIRNLFWVHILYPAGMAGIIGIMLMMMPSPSSYAYEEVRVYNDSTLRNVLVLCALAVGSGLVWGITPVVYLIAYRRPYKEYLQARDLPKLDE